MPRTANVALDFDVGPLLFLSAAIRTELWSPVPVKRLFFCHNELVAKPVTIVLVVQMLKFIVLAPEDDDRSPTPSVAW